MSEIFSGMSENTMWMIIGFLGQGLFFMRFVIQWLATEKAGKSVVPVSFWYFSILGSVILFSYSFFWKQDVVIYLGQVLGLMIYCRNLYFIHAKSKKTSEAAVEA